MDWLTTLAGVVVGLVIVGAIIVLAFRAERKPRRKPSRFAPPSGNADHAASAGTPPDSGNP
jgi:hypothetical protein